ncbi:hypothetical protein ASD11_00800 [Aeromicrobium sp. Root495]|uniref:MCE family protein n=1 Tax=Aeromicrobium sp. Root495 TaxID=1736550 RepID=UPI0006F74F7A|nr:MCE family protein [Aeromicrobium sp. Root495]KQY58242.1 hypothetical protein ASD11_00800 [Aeromicrobium sp. Root495]
MEEKTSRLGTQVKGVAGLLVIALIVALLIGMYQKAFVSVTHVTVVSDRAGLQLDKGSSVRAFGVPVGEVRGVEVQSDGVAIDVAIDKDKVGSIPAGVKATIRATTVFGAKFVQLDVPRGKVTDVIQAGAIVRSTDTTIEANDVFEHAMTILDALHPEKLNTTLTAMATALDGNGEKLGSLVTDTDNYLEALNPHLDQLGDDLQLTEDVGRNVNDVLPQAIDTVDQLNTTTDLVTDTQKDFDDLLKDIVPAADSVGGLIESFDQPLDATVQNLLRPSRLLKEYSPALPCTLDGLIDHVNILGEALGRKRPAADADAGFLPGMKPYNQSNLPKLVTGVGPKCYQQATRTFIHPPHIQFDDGTKDVYTDSTDPVGISKDPITLYQDTVRSFLGNSGLNELLNFFANEEVDSSEGTS